MKYKSLYENLGAITKQLPSKLYETDKGSKVDGNHKVGDVVTKEKSGKKKVCVFSAQEWRELPANKGAAQKLAEKIANETIDTSDDKAEIKRLQDENLQLQADKKKAEDALALLNKPTIDGGDANNA